MIKGNDFTGASDSMKENMEKGVKWMQEANQKFVESQKQQIKQMTDMANKTPNSSEFSSFNKFDNPFADSTKAFTEMFKKNTKAITDMFGGAVKPVEGMPNFSNFSDKESMSKDMSAQFDTLKTKIEDFTILNQGNVDKLLSEFDKTANTFTPLTEQAKHELEKAFESYKETFQGIAESYSAFAAPSAEPFNESINKMNEETKKFFKDNLSFLKNFSNEASPAKAKKAKVDSRIIKTTGKNKKQSAASMN